MRSKIALLTLALLLAVGTASADSFVFNNTAGGTWSAGLSGFTGDSQFTSFAGSLDMNGGTFLGGSSTVVNNLAVHVQTGAATGVNAGQIQFSNTGSTFTIYGNIGAGIEQLFSGSLANASITELTPGGAWSFTASFIIGGFSSDFMTWANGFAGCCTSVDLNAKGDTQFNLFGNVNYSLDGNGNLIALSGTDNVSGSLTHLNNVPEPASMFLLGSGLLGAGTFVRRKLIG